MAKIFCSVLVFISSLVTVLSINRHRNMSRIHFNSPNHRQSCSSDSYNNGCFARTEERNQWHDFACPVETTTQNCYFQRMSARSKLLENIQFPYVVSDFAAPLLKLFKGRKVLFIGDSLMTQFYQSLICFFHTHLLSTKSPLPKYKVEVRFGLPKFLFSNCPYGSDHCELSTACLNYASHDTKLCTSPSWPNLCRYHKNAASSYVRSQQLTSNDIIIVNMGMWYGEYTGETTDFAPGGNYETNVVSLVEELRSLNVTSHILWMESPPQHFPGSANGYFNNNDTSLYDKVREGVENAVTDPTTTNLTCTPLLNFTAARVTDHRNRVVERALRDLRVPIIPMWDHLWNLSQAHVVLPRRRDNNRWNLDCTHWCLPGPFYHVVPYTLYRTLTQDNILPLITA
jgi:hypothetical protein